MKPPIEEAITTLTEEKDALTIWLTADLPEDVREGMEISLDKIEKALARIQKLDAPTTFTVHSSHGTFTVDVKTGGVIEFNRDRGCDDLSFIHQFDITEYKDYHGIEEWEDFPSDVDILALGYNYKDHPEHGSGYQPPEEDYRR